MNVKTIVKNAYLRTGIALVTGLVLGRLIFGTPDAGDSHAGHNHETADAAGGALPLPDEATQQPQLWTCSMHPQIRQDKPGKCPLCAMDLVPLKKASSAAGDAFDPDALLLSDEAAALAGIQTTLVRKGRPVKEIQLYGTIQPNERLVHSQVSHVSGRIERLLVDFTGESVRSGQVIASIYSPDLQNAQQELLEAAKLKDTQPVLLEAAREKLRRWKLSDGQVSLIEQSGNVSPLMDITANTHGIVIAKNVSQGDYVSQGSVLFSVADLSSVWVMFEAYEADLPYLKTGESITYTVQALPGKTFSGKITFIDPVLNRASRTARVRVETANAGNRLKPEMYAGATVHASAGQGENVITIPGTAVLWTGKRSIVYVKQADSDTPAFRLREIELGPALGNSYVVLSGLEEGEEIVTGGAFTVDASAQLEGKPSMMNSDAAPAAAGHGGSDTSSVPPDGNRQHLSAQIKVQGLCEMCKERIEQAAMSVNGVSSASWDPDTLRLRLDYDPSKTNEDEISKAIAKAGHDTDRHKAPHSTYGALPECCKYRQ
ncbi:MAG: efflux RND transporter periplasmic adaptor subunit [Tannerella sp.]|jgi:Cu(I)/Ag(I) efflux system membrane fusion protein|nr:efflux RND transporter periplasmic adaptor subunit [Tannerella sp.]